jgi:hypothetical protein
MNKKKISNRSLAAILMGIALLVTGCSRNEFDSINTDPTTIGTANVQYLLTQEQTSYQPFDYLLWFYDGSYTSHLDQAYTPSGSFNDLFNRLGSLGGVGSQFLDTRKYELEIKNTASSADNPDQYKAIEGISNILTVSLAITDADMFGSMPYSETCKLKFGGTLTPSYENQETLFKEWLDELNGDIASLGTKNQLSIGKNDIVYNGDYSKWVKFANGLKLKIAVRLLHQDKTEAFKIAEEVGASDNNIMNGLTDDYIYNRGTIAGDGGNDDYVYQTGNSVSLGSASKNVIDFMKKNKDPRMLVMFTKNDFNKEVIQAFFDAEANGDTRVQVPKYILDNVNYTTDGSGKKTFVSWKDAGEPWCRYYGIPIGIDLNDNPAYTGEDNYFTSSRWKVTVGDKSKTYTPYSSFNEELVRGRCDFTYPTKPDGSTYQDTEDVPWWGMTMSTAEMNLYLAEFKTLGANLPKSAETYFKTAVEASCREYEDLAVLNKIPYTTEQSFYSELGDKVITYGDTDIEALMGQSDYQLTGDKASDLEKIYLQMYLHFYYQPIDQFVTARRSGVPETDSKLIPWVSMKASNEIPRRFYEVKPSDADKMKDQIEDAYSKEGFTFTDGSDPTLLNTERVWYDKGAPEFGAGPNY